MFNPDKNMTNLKNNINPEESGQIEQTTEKKPEQLIKDRIAGIIANAKKDKEPFTISKIEQWFKNLNGNKENLTKILSEVIKTQTNKTEDYKLIEAWNIANDNIFTNSDLGEIQISMNEGIKQEDKNFKSIEPDIKKAILGSSIVNNWLIKNHIDAQKIIDTIFFTKTSPQGQNLEITELVTLTENAIKYAPDITTEKMPSALQEEILNLERAA